MAISIMQKAFHAGELAPALYARVDLAKYHAACALAENYFVDYRGGLSSRPGTKYILQAWDSANEVRLIPFQASQQVSYILEFGEGYIRFFNNGAPVLQTALNITNLQHQLFATITVPGHTYVEGDWIYITGIGGVPALNNKYYRVGPILGAFIQIRNILDDTVVPWTGTYTGGGTAARVYTVASPYSGSQLAALKFTQTVNQMIFCHPEFTPYVLTIESFNNWTMLPAQFGATISAPTNVAVSSSLAGATTNYSYVVTAVDVNGQESAPSSPGTLLNRQDMRSVSGSNQVTWVASAGAVSFNVYKANLSIGAAVPSGAAHGFIGNCTGPSFTDTNIQPDFSITPPIPRNPFQGSGITSVSVTNTGAYTSVPTATVPAPPAGDTATVSPTLTAISQTIDSSEAAFFVNDYIRPRDVAPVVGGLRYRVTSVDSNGRVTGVVVVNPGSISSGSVPSNPIRFVRELDSDDDVFLNVTWGVTIVNVVNPGSGYLADQPVTFSSGSATATALVGSQFSGNPTSPVFFQQRLVLAAPEQDPQTLFMSRPGTYFNFDESNPTQPQDAITLSIVSNQLNTIRYMVPMPAGLVVLTDKACWVVNGGGTGVPISAIDFAAQAQSYNGISNVPPIVANFDILYVQAKGSVIRDTTYNFYANIFTGTDISVLSSHLFYGHQILEWCWAEEPFKVVWAVRDDGVLLSCTFMKEQELIGWTHSTTEGLFKSIAEVVESVNNFGLVNAVYHVVEREIDGNTVKYIERFDDRNLARGKDYAWCVDAGLRYEGSPSTQFSGAEHLSNTLCVGLADGVPFETTVDQNGNFTLPTPASVVTIGLRFTPLFRNLALDLGEPTVQGKQKMVAGVDIRVQDTLGLWIGRTLDTLVEVSDLTLGQISTMMNAEVTDLLTGDARQVVDPMYDTFGQFYISQPNPYPVTLLGLIPEVTVGDTSSK